MKPLILLFLIILSPHSSPAFSEIGDENMLFSSREFIYYWDSASPKFNKLKKKLEKDFQRFEKSEKFLKMLFHRSQHHLLYEYDQYASVEELIESGKFDCVSGSLLMASFLDFFGFDYKIIETSYHVFLLVQIDNQQIILESTDSFNGFISDKEDIVHYLDKFKSEARNNKLYLHPDQKVINSLLKPSIYRHIDLQKLKGLEHFNRAIHYNNQKDLEKAFEEAKKAEFFYESDRILTLRQILQSQLSLAVNN